MQNCIIDTRVSTDKQLAGNGLENQKATCKYFAEARNWNIKHVFAKSYSGRKEEREDFSEILDYIQKTQRAGIKIDYYLVKGIDRFTRAGASLMLSMQKEIESLGVELVDVEGLIQPKANTLEHLGVVFPWSEYSPSGTATMIHAENALSEVRNSLTRMIGTEIALTRKGYSMRTPNDGYLNTKIIELGKEMSVLQQDPDRVQFFKMMFEMRASGQYSDKEIIKKVNALGYLSKSQNIHKKEGGVKIIIGKTTPKQLTVKQLQKILQRTIYAGIKYEKWNDTPVAVVFAPDERPIVSVEIFNQANRGKVYIKLDETGSSNVLYDFVFDEKNIRSRKKYHPDYKFDKMATCDNCSKPLKNSGKGNRGKLGKYYQGYHCDRTPECKEVTGRISKETYENQLTGLLNKVTFSDGFANKLEERLIKRYRVREKEVLGQSIVIGENVTELKREQATLLNSFPTATSDVMRRHIEKQVEILEKRIVRATEERDKIEIEERDVKTFVKYAKDLVEHPAKMLANNRNPYAQKALFSLVFEEPLTYTQVVNGTPNLSFIFKLSSTKVSTKSSLVTLRGIEPRFHG